MLIKIMISKQTITFNKVKPIKYSINDSIVFAK